jgi:hypothetical protein
MQISKGGIFLIGILTGLVLSVVAQQPTTAILSDVTPVPPSDAASAALAGSCKFSTSGYLFLNGKDGGFSDSQVGEALMSSLRQGYVITIYPPTKRGIWLNQECRAATK